jgi:trans-2,3-dihydro-3-hydroxyanthranilate isomerase
VSKLVGRIVLWDLNGSQATIDQLRTYLHDESVDAFAEVDGLVFKAWISDPETNSWGAFYVWEGRSFADQPLPSKARELIGKDPYLREDFDIEATVQGRSSIKELARLGLAFGA